MFKCINMYFKRRKTEPTKRTFCDLSFQVTQKILFKYLLCFSICHTYKNSSGVGLIPGIDARYNKINFEKSKETNEELFYGYFKRDYSRKIFQFFGSFLACDGDLQYSYEFISFLPKNMYHLTIRRKMKRNNKNRCVIKHLCFCDCDNESINSFKLHNIITPPPKTVCLTKSVVDKELWNNVISYNPKIIIFKWSFVYPSVFEQFQGTAKKLKYRYGKMGDYRPSNSHILFERNAHDNEIIVRIKYAIVEKNVMIVILVKNI